MKNAFIFLVIVLCLVTYSCQPPVTFREPQPEGCKDELAVPKRLLGRYLSSFDSSLLIINDNGLFRRYEVLVGFSLKDSGQFVVKGDSLLDLGSGIRYAALKKRDSLFASISVYDTLFVLGESGVIRKFKGYYFFNRKLEDTGWEVSKLSLQRGVLSIGRVTDASEINLLKSISYSAMDTMTPYGFSLNRDEFRTFLRNKGFGDKEVFFRLK